jgi:DNA-binding XRE family transcriptional regulator
MSQVRLAKYIDASRQTLNAIARGQRLPSLETAHRIADALNCTLDGVFRYESEFPAKDDGRPNIIVSFDDEGDGGNLIA